MMKWFAVLGLCVGALIGLMALQDRFVPQHQMHDSIMLAQLTPEQAQCQQEAAQLQAQLSQCSNDACRQNVQAAIAAHNQRCG
jgi:hypothetical protein